MATGAARRKLIAVVHADVKGYSRMMGEDDEYTVRTLASNREEMYRQVKLNSGEVVDTAGDGFLVEFPSVVDAVKFSVDFQREMKTRNADLPEDRKMEFRIGVNIGDVIHDGGTIYGDGVNIAARIESLADPGGICISGAAYDQVKKRLELDYEYLGDKSVKNISEPVPTYKVFLEPGESSAGIRKPPLARQSSWTKSSVLVAGIILAVVASVATWHFYFQPAPSPDKIASEQAPELPLPDKPSIAVLPFNNMSGDPDQEYFSDGITEAIITGLSKMPRLFVIARNSSFAFKGKKADVKEVGRKLGVRYVLEGSVQKQRNRVRITAQLVDAQTGGHKWSERYDRELKDIFALQDEITLEIIRAMRVELTEGEQARLWRRKRLTDNLQAYEQFLQAREYTAQLNKAATTKARPLYEEAIAKDPQFATAYAMLSHLHLFEAMMGWSHDREASARQASKLAIKALELDETLDVPHYVLGLLFCYVGKHDQGIAQGERAVELNPNGTYALSYLGVFMNVAGRPEEGLSLIQRAIRLNPLPRSWQYWILGMSYKLMDQSEKAMAAYEKGLRINPEDTGCLLALVDSYVHAGRLEDARKTAKAFVKLDSKFSLKRFQSANIYKDKVFAKRLADNWRKAGLK
jgi:adenylate cyclase